MFCVGFCKRQIKICFKINLRNNSGASFCSYDLVFSFFYSEFQTSFSKYFIVLYTSKKSNFNSHVHKCILSNKYSTEATRSSLINRFSKFNSCVTDSRFFAESLKTCLRKIIVVYFWIIQDFVLKSSFLILCCQISKWQLYAVKILRNRPWLWS